MTKELFKAALIRAFRTLCQELGTTLPVGIVITPAVIEHFNVSYVYIVLAWLFTGLLGAIAAFFTALATGLPEAMVEIPEGEEELDGEETENTEGLETEAGEM